MTKSLTGASSNPVQWGIIGTGKISKKFVRELRHAEGARGYAVASRSSDKAEGFAHQHDFSASYGSVSALCNDPNVDIVYVGSPTRLHRHHAELVLEADKGVLCEKPFGQSIDDAQAIIRKARIQNLFCMEAMWMRFNPLIQQVRDAIAANEIGDVRYLHAELGYKKDPSTLSTAERGHGALLAFGCYGISLALFLFGTPNTVQSSWIANQEGGDETVALTLSYDQIVVTLCFSERVTLSNDVRIKGTGGAIHVGSPFIDATELEIINLQQLQDRSLLERVRARVKRLWPGQHKSPFEYKLEEANTGFRYEAQEVTECMASGKTESTIMPLSETLTVHRILDAALRRPHSSMRLDA